MSDGVDAYRAYAHQCRYLDQIRSVSGVASVFDGLLTNRERWCPTVLMLIVLMLIIVEISTRFF